LAAALASGEYFDEAVSELRGVDDELSALSLRTMQSSDQYPAIRKEVNGLLFRVACSMGNCEEARSWLGTMLAGVSGHEATGRYGLPSNGTMLRIDTMSELACANYVAGHFETALSQSQEVYFLAKTRLGPSDVKTVDAATTVALSQMAAHKMAKLRSDLRLRGQALLLRSLATQLVTHAAGMVGQSPPESVRQFTPRATTAPRGGSAGGAPTAEARASTQAGLPVGARAGIGASKAPAAAAPAELANPRSATAAIAEVPFRGETGQAALDLVAKNRALACRNNARMEQSTSDKGMHTQAHVLLYRDD
jgi:hypothetical protein